MRICVTHEAVFLTKSTVKILLESQEMTAIVPSTLIPNPVSRTAGEGSFILLHVWLGVFIYTANLNLRLMQHLLRLITRANSAD